MDAATADTAWAGARSDGSPGASRPSRGARGVPPRRPERQLHTPALWRAAARSRWSCGCGGSSRACPTATTSTRRRTSSRGRSRSSRRNSTRTTSSTRRRTPTCCTSCSSCGSAAPTRSTRAYTTDPTAVFVVARVVAARARHGRRVAHLPGRRAAFRPHRRAARPRRSSASRSCRSSTATWRSTTCRRSPRWRCRCTGSPGVMRRGRAPRLRDRRGRGRARRGDQVHRRDHAGLPARRRCLRRRGGRSLWSRRRRLMAALLVGLLAVRARQPVRAARLLAPSGSGVSQQASLAAGEDPVKLGTTAGQRDRLLPVDVHLGPRLGAGAGRARRRRCSCWSARRLAMALVLLPAPIAFIIFMGDQQRFFGRWLMPIFPIVALLGGLRRGRAGPLAGPRARRVPAPLAGAAAVVLLLAQSLVSVHPQRRGAVAPGHPQPDPRLDGQPRPGRGQGGDRAGRARQLGQRRRASRCRGRARASAGSAGRPG